MIARIRSLGNVLFNAMVYKELTQGIRSQAFLLLFMLLLGVGWTILLLTWWVADQSGQDMGGTALFFLFGLLSLYSLIVGVRAYGLTIKEIENRTFELYQLAGMTPERLVRGKVVTLFYQFMFGVSTIVPFMFSAYFLKGLDFKLLFILLFLLVMGVIWWYTLSVYAALAKTLTPMKGTITFGYFIAMIGIIVFGMITVTVAAYDGGQSLVSGWSEFWTIDDEIFLRLIVVALFYGMPLALVWVMSCNVVCPETDTREHYIKMLLLVALLLGFSLLLLEPSASAMEWVGWRSAIILVTAAAFGWIHRETMPVMTAVTRLTGTRVQRIMLRLFAPGRGGTALMLGPLFLLCSFMPVIVDFVYQLISSAARPHSSILSPEVLAIWMLPGAFFLQLVAWNALVCKIPALREDYARRRVVIVALWGVTALFAAAPTMLSAHLREPWWEAIPFLGVVLGHFVSPFMTATVLGISGHAPNILLIGLLNLGGIWLAFYDAWRLDPVPPTVRRALAATGELEGIAGAMSPAGATELAAAAQRERDRAAEGEHSALAGASPLAATSEAEIEAMAAKLKAAEGEQDAEDSEAAAGADEDAEQKRAPEDTDDQEPGR